MFIPDPSPTTSAAIITSSETYQTGQWLRQFWIENSTLAYFVLAAIIFWGSILVLKLFYLTIARLIGSFAAETVIAYRKTLEKEIKSKKHL